MHFIIIKDWILYSEKMTKNQRWKINNQQTIFGGNFSQFVKQFWDDIKFQLFIENVNHMSLERHTD